DVRGAGALSDETVARDRAARKQRETAEAGPTAASVEAEGVVARAGTAVAVAEDRTPAPFVPADPEAIGVSRGSGPSLPPRSSPSSGRRRPVGSAARCPSADTTT
ncbi:MAG: hypothetical protein VW685_09655, partial [Ilumatobacter sp.]